MPKKRLLITLVSVSAALIIAVPLIIYLRSHHPSQWDIPFMPYCWVNRYLGIYCPGCGLTRMLYYLVNFRFYAAFRMNPLMFILLILAAVWTLTSLIRRKPVDIPLWAVIVFAVTVVLFMILRNIPSPPFSYLAPTEVFGPFGGIIAL